jgi:signal transduction histidine kinase
MLGIDTEPATMINPSREPWRAGALNGHRSADGGQEDETLRQLSLLIVDDQDANVTLLARQLAGAGYANVRGTTDPTLVFDMCRREQPDLLLLDLHMPRLDGFQIMARLKPLLAENRLPILVLSGDLSPEARRRALSLGASDFLSKPLDPIEVLLRVHNLLETHHLHMQLERRNELLSRHLTERTMLMERFRDANIQLETANQAKNRFLANMSHELRAPLNAILGYTELLLMKGTEPLTGKQSSQLQIVQSSGQHLLSLIDDLLDLARIEAGKTELKIEPVDCRGLLNEVAAWLAPLADTKQLRFSVTAEAELRISSDRRVLKQIMLNLAGNAVKFTQHGEVRIGATRAERAGTGITRFTVADTGCGVDAADQQRLFEPFEQIGPSRHQGTGLGLAICQTLARLIGATIACESEPGKGSLFTLEIPD